MKKRKLLIFLIISAILISSKVLLKNLPAVLATGLDDPPGANGLIVAFGGTDVESKTQNQNMVDDMPGAVNSNRYQIFPARLDVYNSSTNPNCDLTKLRNKINAFFSDEYSKYNDAYNGETQALHPIFFINNYSKCWKFAADAQRSSGSTPNDPGWVKPWDAKIDPNCTSNCQTWLGRFIYEFANKYKELYPNRQFWIELGNEVDCRTTFDPATTNHLCFYSTNNQAILDYAAILRYIYRVVHTDVYNNEANKAIVIPAGLALEPVRSQDGYSGFNWSFFANLMNEFQNDSNGVGFDAVAFHYYSAVRYGLDRCNWEPACEDPQNPGQYRTYKDFWNAKGHNERGIFAKLFYVKNIIDSFPDLQNTPLYITESNVGLKIPPYNVAYPYPTPAGAAYSFYKREMVREAVRAASDSRVKGWYLYSIHDESFMYKEGNNYYCSTESSSCTSYGITRRGDGWDEKDNLWHSFKYLHSKIHDKSTADVSNPRINLEAYQFPASNPDYVIAWSIARSSSPVTYSPFPNFDVADLNGTIIATNQTSWSVGPGPVYLIKVTPPTNTPTPTETPSPTPTPSDTPTPTPTP